MKAHSYLRIRAALPGLLACLLAAPTQAYYPHRLRLAPAAISAQPGVLPGANAIWLRQEDSTRRNPPRKLPVAAPLTSSRFGRPAATAPAAGAALPQVVLLRGVVLRTSGQPCAGASVYAAQAPRQVVATDAQGAFTLSVPAGTAVLLRVEYFGEGSSRVEVPLPTTASMLRITLGQ